MLRQITFAPTFAAWQRAARQALREESKPEEILWQELDSDQPLLDIGGELEPAKIAPSRKLTVPKSFVEIATRVACHSAPERWSLLYRILWRLTHGEKHLMAISVDPDRHALGQMDQAIRHDVHKMRAFVRFRAIRHAGEEWYVAWFEPRHHIVELNAPFFVDRFAGMCWSVLTPERCAHWDGKNLSFTGGVERSEAPAEDVTEQLWLKYYSHIFNPARVKVHAMQAEMPKKYWKNLPEAAVIPVLLREAPARVNSMMAKSRAREVASVEMPTTPVPVTSDLAVVRAASMQCKACPLYKDATQTVFGEGPPKARLVLLGEQPGDAEDRAGHPFVGPAGQLLDRALADAGIHRELTYITNSVKHFKWQPSDKRRMHRTASPPEIAACRPWLEAEMRIIAPQALVCLGGTAARTVFGGQIRVLRDRGQFMLSEFSPLTLITVHPSSLLRERDEEMRARDYARFVADLRLVAERLR